MADTPIGLATVLGVIFSDSSSETDDINVAVGYLLVIKSVSCTPWMTFGVRSFGSWLYP